MLCMAPAPAPSPISMKATNDSKAVFEAIGKLAGLTVIFDPDFTSRRISVELTNVTLEQALNISALQSKAFWRPVTLPRQTERATVAHTLRARLVLLHGTEPWV